MPLAIVPAAFAKLLNDDVAFLTPSSNVLVSMPSTTRSAPTTASPAILRPHPLTDLRSLASVVGEQPRKLALDLSRRRAFPAQQVEVGLDHHALENLFKDAQ